MVTGKKRAGVVLGFVVLAGLVALGVFALLGRGPSTPPVAVPDATTEAPPPGPPRAPLTGIVVDDPASLDHPAVAIKVSDVPQAHPHVGVDRADLVFVEPIGAAYTRVAAVFHSDIPDSVGPVRSVRPMDAALLGPLSAVFGNTMGAEWVMRYVDEVADLDDLGTLRVDAPGAYVLDPNRPRPDNVIADPQVLLSISDRTDPPRPYVDHATGLAASSAARARAPGTSVEIPYGPGWNVRWTYDPAAHGYLREQPWGPHETVDGVQVAAVNVVVLRAESRVQKLREGAGAPVPVLQFVDATGSFVALSGGHQVSGTWTKGGVNEPFQLTTAAGDQLQLAPGNTWFELPDPMAEVTVR